ncbi:MAG: hypothetical protein HRU12_06975, partial [Phaeodactylibacter sp.]|nr:hypothetical protein [Phaeodactylibacter sp.]
MRVLSALAGIGVIVLCCSWHPLKMSYTAIKYGQENSRLNVSFRVFQDDVEAAFLRNYGYRCNIVEQANDSLLLAYLEGYFDQVFDCWLEDEEVCFSYLSMQPEQQMGLVLYFESQPVPFEQLTNLDIYNSILINSFPQQVNMFFVALDADRRYTTRMDIKA